MEILIDARAMQPPEPFERTMEALDSIPVGSDVVLWIYRRPEPLFRFAESNAYTVSEAPGPEGSFEFRFRRS